MLVMCHTNQSNYFVFHSILTNQWSFLSPLIPPLQSLHPKGILEELEKSFCAELLCHHSSFLYEAVSVFRYR